MAELILNQPVAEMHGKFTKRGLIHRKKRFRDDRGHVVAEGKQEAYAILHPRDYKKNPPQGAELANVNLWTEACRRTSQILQAGQVGGPTQVQLDIRKIQQVTDYYTLDEARALYEDFRRRFDAQLPNMRGRHADPAAPIDPNTRQGKRYAQFPNFVRALLYHHLRSSQQSK